MTLTPFLERLEDPVARIVSTSSPFLPALQVSPQRKTNKTDNNRRVQYDERVPSDVRVQYDGESDSADDNVEEVPNEEETEEKVKEEPKEDEEEDDEEEPPPPRPSRKKR